MTVLSLAVRNTLARNPGIQDLVGKSATWPTWVFDESPIGAKIEGTGKCLVVVNEDGTWAPPNAHNTMRFPRLIIDVWADPSRNKDRSVRVLDAKEKIERIGKILTQVLHLVDPGDSLGMPIMFGLESEIEAKSGVVVAGSSQLSGPDFSPIRDADGAWMGTFTFGLNVP